MLLHFKQVISLDFFVLRAFLPRLQLDILNGQLVHDLVLLLVLYRVGASSCGVDEVEVLVVTQVVVVVLRRELVVRVPGHAGIGAFLELPQKLAVCAVRLLIELFLHDLLVHHAGKIWHVDLDAVVFKRVLE